MKKLVLFSLFAALAFTVNAQTATPRYRTGASYDVRQLNHTYQTKTDATGADTVTLATNSYSHIYRVVLVDSLTLGQPTVTNCYLGDELTIIASAASGTPTLKFTGSNWVSTGTATLSTGLRAVIRYIFDGAKWVEAERTVQ